MTTPHVPLSLERRIEIELLVNAHPNHRSSGIIRELLKEIDELNKRLDTREKNRAKREAFEPPTHAEVTAEFERLGMNGESRSQATTFIAFYASKGWKVGGQKMISWPDACVTWRKRHAESTGSTPGAGRSPDPRMSKTMEPRL